MAHGTDVITSLRRLKCEIAAARVLESAAEVSRQLNANFDPSQPRVPRGNPDGGQWTSVGGSSSSNGSAQSNRTPQGPLRITVRPRGIGDNGGPPLESPPELPKERPLNRQVENRIARAAVRWLARTALWQTLGPVGTYLTIIEAALWLHEHFPNMQSYLDGPKSLKELQDAVEEPKKGYDIHHIVEQSFARDYGFPDSMIDARENLVRMPRYKHWEINSWYETPNKDLGGLTPRQYLRNESWAERERVGLRGLTEIGVLKR